MRLKDIEGSGIELTFTNKAKKQCILNAKLVFVGKDSVILIDCFQKEYRILRENVIGFKVIKYCKKAKK